MFSLRIYTVLQVPEPSIPEWYEIPSQFVQSPPLAFSLKWKVMLSILSLGRQHLGLWLTASRNLENMTN